MQEITSVSILKPPERHGHLRTYPMAAKVVPYNDLYSEVIAFGNFADNPVDDAKELIKYRNEILALAPKFKPLFGLMVTQKTTPEIVEEAFANGAKFLKTMFIGSTTGSAAGIPIDRVEEKYAVYKKAGELGMPTLWHMERPETKNGKPIPFLCREEEAIPDAEKIINDLPDVKISIEHISTAAMVELVKSSGHNVIATITPHHAFGVYEDACNEQGEIINPHNLCMPILKRKKDRDSVRKAMVGENYTKFRAGSDNAPHPLEAKLKGAPGLFIPDFVALALYCQIFDGEGKIIKFGDFISCNQIDIGFYGISPAADNITLVKENWVVPKQINGLVPYMAGQQLKWKVKR